MFVHFTVCNCMSLSRYDWCYCNTSEQQPGHRYPYTGTYIQVEGTYEPLATCDNRIYIMNKQ